MKFKEEITTIKVKNKADLTCVKEREKSEKSEQIKIPNKTTIPIVYTTRLDDMDIFKIDSSYLINLPMNDVIERLTIQSKPLYRNQNVENNNKTNNQLLDKETRYKDMEQKLDILRQVGVLENTKIHYSLKTPYFTNKELDKLTESDIEEKNKKYINTIPSNNDSNELVRQDVEERNKKLLSMCKPFSIILQDISKKTSKLKNHSIYKNQSRKPTYFESKQINFEGTYKQFIESGMNNRSYYNIKKQTLIPYQNSVLLLNNFNRGSIDLLYLDNLANVTCKVYFELSHSLNNPSLKSLIKNKLVFNRVSCCWYKRETFIRSMTKMSPFVSSAVLNPTQQFLRVPHSCPLGYCTCCCKTKYVKNKINLKNFAPIHTEQHMNNLTIVDPEKAIKNSKIFQVPYKNPFRDSSGFNNFSILKNTRIFKSYEKIKKKLSRPNFFLQNKIIMLTNKNTGNNEIYSIGTTGDIDIHLNCNSSPKDLVDKINLNKPKIFGTLCCWIKRELIIAKLRAKNLKPTVVSYLRKPHSCPIDECSCCCVFIKSVDRKYNLENILLMKNSFELPRNEKIMGNSRSDPQSFINNSLVYPNINDKVITKTSSQVSNATHNSPKNNIPHNKHKAEVFKVDPNPTFSLLDQAARKIVHAVKTLPVLPKIPVSIRPKPSTPIVPPLPQGIASNQVVLILPQPTQDIQFNQAKPISPQTPRVVQPMTINNSLMTSNVDFQPRDFMPPSLNMQSNQLNTANVLSPIVSQHSEKIISKSDIPAGVDSASVRECINTILDTFRDVRLTINNDGKVAAALNTPINNLTTAELRILANIISCAQEQVDALGLFPKNNSSYTVTSNSSHCKTTTSLETDTHNISPTITPKIYVNPNLYNNDTTGNKKGTDNTEKIFSDSRNILNNTVKHLSESEKKYQETLVHLRNLSYFKNANFEKSVLAFLGSKMMQGENEIPSITPIIENVFSLNQTNESVSETVSNRTQESSPSSAKINLSELVGTRKSYDTNKSFKRPLREEENTNKRLKALLETPLIYPSVYKENMSMLSHLTLSPSVKVQVANSNVTIAPRIYLPSQLDSNSTPATLMPTSEVSLDEDSSSNDVIIIPDKDIDTVIIDDDRSSQEAQDGEFKPLDEDTVSIDEEHMKDDDLNYIENNEEDCILGV